MFCCQPLLGRGDMSSMFLFGSSILQLQEQLSLQVTLFALGCLLTSTSPLLWSSLLFWRGSPPSPITPPYGGCAHSGAASHSSSVIDMASFGAVYVRMH